MFLRKLGVNRNFVEPLFPEELAKLSQQLTPEQIRHNEVVKQLYDKNHFFSYKHGAPVYIEPDILYNVAGRQVHHTPDPYSSMEVRNTNFHVTGFNKTPWADWDWPSDEHLADSKSVTVGNLNDVYGLVDEFVNRNKAKARLYLTPKGVHAAILSHRMTPQEFYDANLFDQLRPDGMYKELALKGKPVPNPEKIYDTDLRQRVQQYFIQQPTFNVRVSPKDRPGDPIGDFVGFRLGELGDAMPDPENLRLVDRYHDQAIKRSLANASYDPIVEASKVLGNQLAGLPSTFRDPIEQMLDAYLSSDVRAVRPGTL